MAASDVANSRMLPYVALGLAIIAEVCATSALKASDGFSRLWPSVVVVVGYGVAFALLSVTLRTIPVGIAYAIWYGDPHPRAGARYKIKRSYRRRISGPDRSRARRACAGASRGSNRSG